MATEWRFRVDGVENGPVTALQLRTLAQGAILFPDDLVQKGANGKWVRAAKVQGLFDMPIDPPQGKPKTPFARLAAFHFQQEQVECPDDLRRPAVARGNENAQRTAVAEPDESRGLAKRNIIGPCAMVGIAVIVIGALIGKAYYDSTHFYDDVQAAGKKAVQELDESQRGVTEKLIEKADRDYAKATADDDRRIQEALDLVHHAQAVVHQQTQQAEEEHRKTVSEMRTVFEAIDREVQESIDAKDKETAKILQQIERNKATIEQDKARIEELKR